jgi:hypothetical protein
MTGISSLAFICMSAAGFYVFVAVICEACSYLFGKGVVHDMTHCVSEKKALEKLHQVFKAVPRLKFTLRFHEHNEHYSNWSIDQKFEHVRDNRCVGNEAQPVARTRY